MSVAGDPHFPHGCWCGIEHARADYERAYEDGVAHERARLRELIEKKLVVVAAMQDPDTAVRIDVHNRALQAVLDMLPPVDDPDPSLAYDRDGNVVGRVVGWMGDTPIIDDGTPSTLTDFPGADRD